MDLKTKIETLVAANKHEFDADDRAVFEQLKAALRTGEIRAAEKDPDGNYC